MTKAILSVIVLACGLGPTKGARAQPLDEGRPIALSGSSELVLSRGAERLPVTGR